MRDAPNQTRRRAVRQGRRVLVEALTRHAPRATLSHHPGPVAQALDAVQFERVLAAPNEAGRTALGVAASLGHANAVKCICSLILDASVLDLDARVR